MWYKNEVILAKQDMSFTGTSYSLKCRAGNVLELTKIVITQFMNKVAAVLDWLKKRSPVQHQ